MLVLNFLLLRHITKSEHVLFAIEVCYALLIEFTYIFLMDPEVSVFLSWME